MYFMLLSRHSRDVLTHPALLAPTPEVTTSSRTGALFFSRVDIAMRRMRAKLAVLAVTVAVAACGGGGDAAGPKVSISRVVVAGDSLADAGTFGVKATVQKSSDPATGYPLYPEIVAANFGINSQCAFFRSPAFGQPFSSQAGCTNFAIGGGRIINPASQGGAASPLALAVQLDTALRANPNPSTYGPEDLVIVDDGGNDAADLLTAFLGAASGPTGVADYQAFLAQQLDAPTIATALSGQNGAATAAGLYLQKLADTYWNTIKTSTLDKGATHVAVLNMVDITRTPKVQAVLAQIAAANGGGSTGSAAAAALQKIVQGWIQGFNTQLAANVNSDARIALVPFFEDFTEEMNNPATYGLINITTPVCSEDGFPATCVDAALDASPPAGASAGWWTTYLFSNGFHPTPYGHRLLAASVARAIARAGWL